MKCVLTLYLIPEKSEEKCKGKKIEKKKKLKVDKLFLFVTLNSFVDPVFQLMRFPLDGELDYYLKMILFIKKNDLESPLIFVLFLKG